MAITAGFVWRCIYVDGDGKGPPPPVLDGNDDPNHLEQVMLAPYKTKKTLRATLANGATPSCAMPLAP